MTHPGGRPTDYNSKLTGEMCERIACGESVRSITSDDDMPAMSTFFRWLNEKKEFREQYTIAKELGAEVLFSDIINIADDGTNDYMEKLADGKCIGYQTNGEVIARSRLRVDTRKWYLSKVLPKLYGDKQHVEHSGVIGLNEVLSDISNEKDGLPEATGD